MQVLILSKSMFDIVKQCVWGGQTWCLRVSDAMSVKAKTTKQEPERYSLTILTVSNGLKINSILHFQRLFWFYLNDFSLSKFFIIFRREGKSWWVWHTFCCESEKCVSECYEKAKNCRYCLYIEMFFLYLHHKNWCPWAEETIEARFTYMLRRLQCCCLRWLPAPSVPPTARCRRG